MQRIDSLQNGWQEPMASTPAVELGEAVASAQARTRWLEKTAAGSRQSPWSDGSAQSLAGLIHDARNMVSAMDLYCDLLEEPGVLSSPFHHYAGELRLVSNAGRRLLEKLAVAESVTELQSAVHSRNVSSSLSRLRKDSCAMPAHSEGSLDRSNRASRRSILPCGRPVADLAEELRGNHNLLSALVGPGIIVGLSISGGRRPVAMAGDDLTRVLVNLARNAAEAMPFGGHLQIALEEGAEYLSLTLSDNGPGIPETALEAIFAPGYSTRVGAPSAPVAEPASGATSCAWPVQHRGLGLSIVRSIVTAAGGSIWAANGISVPGRNELQPAVRDRSLSPEAVFEDTSTLQGAIFVIEFPLTESSIGT